MSLLWIIEVVVCWTFLAEAGHHDQPVGNLVEAYQDGSQVEDHQDHQEGDGSPLEDQAEVWIQAGDHLEACLGEVWSREEASGKKMSRCVALRNMN